jgi:glucuronosyltransferase
MFKVILLALIFHISVLHAARILAYYPMPCFSHSLVFRKLTNELIERGHEVVVITPYVQYSKKSRPANLTEIDVSQVTFNRKEELMQLAMNIQTPYQIIEVLHFLTDLIEAQLSSVLVQNILKNSSDIYDLFIIEGAIDPAMIVSYKSDVPVIQFESIGLSPYTAGIVGATYHPFVFPTHVNRKFVNLTTFERLYELLVIYLYNKSYEIAEYYCNDMFQRVVGPNAPPVAELRERTTMVFVNAHPVWDFNRPVSPNVIYLGGFHLNAPKELPEVR